METNVIPMKVKPKVVSERYNGQAIVLRFNPDAVEESNRWNWEVKITREYVFTGKALSEVKARQAAQAKIVDACGAPAAKRIV